MLSFFEVNCLVGDAMHKIGLLTIVILLLFSGAAWAVGEVATDFSLKDMRNSDFRLGDHLGEKVIIVSFWMTWCKPCLVEMPQLEKLYKKYKQQGLLIVSINADEPAGVARAKAIARQKRVTYPVLFDSATSVTGIYNPSKAFPYTMIIGRDKKIHYIKKGFSAGDEKLLEEEIKKLLAE